MEGVSKSRTVAHDAERVRNFELAALVSYAFHKPSDMPKFEAIGAEKAPVSDAVSQLQVRAFLQAMANKS